LQADQRRALDDVTWDSKAKILSELQKIKDAEKASSISRLTVLEKVRKVRVFVERLV
jgi:hypothetical protein